MRWGTSSDLSSSYLGEVTVSVSAQGFYEFVFANTTTQLSTSTTYYFGMISAGTTTTVYRDSANPYANGVYILAPGGSGYNMSSSVGTTDMRFKIKRCN
jgi:hypothetical protein